MKLLIDYFKNNFNIDIIFNKYKEKDKHSYYNNGPLIKVHYNILSNLYFIEINKFYEFNDFCHGKIYSITYGYERDLDSEIFIFFDNKNKYYIDCSFRSRKYLESKYLFFDNEKSYKKKLKQVLLLK